MKKLPQALAMALSLTALFAAVTAGCSLPVMTDINAMGIKKSAVFPTEVQVTERVHSITLSWREAPAAESYSVYRSDDGGNTYHRVGSPSYSPYTDRGLTQSTAYFYKVSASVAQLGEGHQSEPIAALTKPLSPPTGIIARVISAARVDLSWDAADASGYKIYRSTSAA
jgi:fibronectin type 3 domain-containing protein